MISRASTIGLILAGGRGARMGGRDKGLQLLHGRPLVEHVAQRLRPQVSRLLISANRHVDQYARFADQVLTDTTPDFPGPLAGILEGLYALDSQALMHGALLVAPCDSPFVPLNLAQRLAQALEVTHAPIAYACTASPDATAPGTPATPLSSADTPAAGRAHFVFALLRTGLAGDLATQLAQGERRVRTWYARHMAVQVPFADEHAFYNVNSLQELYKLERPDTGR
ncbi:molybdopterin-guanine dinucleotide biosynthesis protein A [Burkholderia sp. b14]|nr:molybdopterin-guanine dinucleotide biosynthesis protein A [Burkholderia sp. b13]SIT81374.1 molybdopterin-guanine dinucleotide biosynthesis protein A [Burkholderia sp. b14]